MLRRLILAAGLLSLACVGTGCGTSVDRDHARRATQTLYAAAQRHDGATACAQMSPSLRAQLVQDESRPCATAVLRLRLTGRTPDHVEVYANDALVRLSDGDTIFLSDTREGWRVDALGCRPQGNGPYDCEAAA